MESFKPIKVVIVEDNPNDQELLRIQLRKTGFAEGILFLDDPLKALDLLQGPRADELRETLVAILSDVHLPHISGIDLLRIIRNQDGFEHLPVMIMTSCPHPDTVAACEELKVAAFVEKPVTMGVFTKVLAPLFHSRPLATSARVHLPQAAY